MTLNVIGAAIGAGEWLDADDRVLCGRREGLFALWAVQDDRVALWPDKLDDLLQLVLLAKGVRQERFRKPDGGWLSEKCQPI